MDCARGPCGWVLCWDWAPYLSWHPVAQSSIVLHSAQILKFDLQDRHNVRACVTQRTLCRGVVPRFSKSTLCSRTPCVESLPEFVCSRASMIFSFDTHIQNWMSAFVSHIRMCFETTSSMGGLCIAAAHPSRHRMFCHMAMCTSRLLRATSVHDSRTSITVEH